MNKIDYLRQSFSHMHGKTFENYVITQVWAGVKHLSLFPVTQQYVKRPQGTYALIDLYFPQIEFAVEVDEKAHEKNITHDKMRMDDIFKSVKTDDNSSIVFSRIKEGAYDDVENSINETIDKIKERSANYTSLTWDENWQQKEYQDKLKKIEQKGRLELSDSIGFTRVQVTNDIFGMNMSEGYLQFGKSWFNFGEKSVIWFPHLTPNKRWQNTINSDWAEIRESRIDGKEALLSPKHHTANILRYTFAKYKNVFGEISYRYIGNFRYKDKKGDTFYYTRDSDNNFVDVQTK